MPDSKEQLRRLLDSMPLDSIQRKAAEEGIENLSQEDAKEIADDLEGALDELPKVLQKLEEALDEPTGNKEEKWKS